MSINKTISLSVPALILSSLIACGGNMTDTTGRYDLKKDKNAPNEYSIDFKSEAGTTYDENLKLYTERARQACPSGEILTKLFYSSTSSSSGLMPVGGTNMFIPTEHSSRFTSAAFFCNPTEIQQMEVAEINNKWEKRCNAVAAKDIEAAGAEFYEATLKTPEMFRMICEKIEIP